MVLKYIQDEQCQGLANQQALHSQHLYSWTPCCTKSLPGCSARSKVQRSCKYNIPLNGIHTGSKLLCKLSIANDIGAFNELPQELLCTPDCTHDGPLHNENDWLRLSDLKTGLAVPTHVMSHGVCASDSTECGKMPG